MKSISIGVKEFALPSPFVGSLDSYVASNNSGYGTLPVQGPEVHTYFLNKRKKQTPGFEIELKLEKVFKHKGYEVKVSGRLDGLRRIDSLSILEEVKSDFDIKKLARTLKDSPEHPYCLQLRTYGYFFKCDREDSFKLNLILVSIKDGESTSLEVEFDEPSYEAWLERRLDEVVDDYEALLKRRSSRKEISGRLSFPFESLRAGQSELIDEVRQAVKKEESFITQAPTGLGKTVGVLFPALGESLAKGDQVIYVTAKNAQHAAVVDAVEKINGKNTEEDKLKLLVLTAKSKICLKDEVFCDSGYCEYARDYFTKLNEHKVLDEVSGSCVQSKDDFVRLGKKYKVCPFELSLDSIERADIVVGDYNYVFSPRNIMGRFAQRYKERGHKPTLLIDEAHNLPQRAKSYYSAEISEEVLLDIKKRIEKQLPIYSIKGQALVEEVLDVLRSHKVGTRYSVRQVKLSNGLFDQLKAKVNDFVSEYMRSVMVLQQNDPLLEFNSLVADFADCLGHSGDEFVQIVKPENKGTLKIVCLDASAKLKEAYRKTKSTIAFSATIKPFDYFSKVLGFEDQVFSVKEFDSPFPSANRKLLIVPQVSTKYADRPRNYGKISEAIKRIVGVRPGNYVVFFPSFKFLEEVLSITRLKDSAILAQRRGMTLNEVKDYLEKLASADSRVVLFAVQGGIFSEGIDYAGDMLIGAIIVGPGLPTFDLEAELLQSYFEERYGEGYRYTFVYPAMTKVIQSAGRVIRSEKDRGLIVLLGKRFLTPAYKEAMPEYWLREGEDKLVSSSILADIEAFWCQKKVAVKSSKSN